MVDFYYTYKIVCRTFMRNHLILIERKALGINSSKKCDETLSTKQAEHQSAWLCHMNKWLCYKTRRCAWLRARPCNILVCGVHSRVPCVLSRLRQFLDLLKGSLSLFWGGLFAGFFWGQLTFILFSTNSFRLG